MTVSSTPRSGEAKIRRPVSANAEAAAALDAAMNCSNANFRPRSRNSSRLPGGIASNGMWNSLLIAR
jgi:hypothetical protein